MIKYKVLYYQRYHCLSKTHRHIKAGRWGVESFLCKMFQALKSSQSHLSCYFLCHIVKQIQNKSVMDFLSFTYKYISLSSWMNYSLMSKKLTSIWL